MDQTNSLRVITLEVLRQNVLVLNVLVLNSCAIIEKMGCSKSVRPSTVIHHIYITQTDFEHYFYHLFRVRVVWSKWTFHKKFFFCWDTKNVLCIQNWWTNPIKGLPTKNLLFQKISSYNEIINVYPGWVYHLRNDVFCEAVPLRVVYRS